MRRIWDISAIFFWQVASIYRDASIGNAINIVVVKIVLLEADQVGHM